MNYEPLEQLGVVCIEIHTISCMYFCDSHTGIAGALSYECLKVRSSVIHA